MTNLYDISEKYARLVEMSLEDDQPESMKEAIKNTLEVIEEDLNTKGINIAHVLYSYDNDINVIKAERARLAEKIRTITNYQEGLKAYLRDNMNRCGITKIKSPLFSVSIGKPSKSVVIDDIDRVPDNYIRLKKEPKKSEIKQAIKDGHTIPGAYIEDGKPRLTIK